MLDGISLKQKQLLSVVFSLLVYAWMFSWQASILIVVAIGFHEASHLWAAKKLGLQTSGFFLMPFLGGVALVRERYKSLGQQAFVVLLGPVGGGLLAVATAVAFLFTGLPFLGAAAAWMCYLNLFNLLPFSFMDGGQLLDTVSYSINRNLGFALRIVSNVAAAIILFKLAPLLAGLVVIFGAISLVKEYNNWKAFRSGNKWECSEDYLNPPKSLTGKQMALTVTGWLVTAGVLSFTMAKIVMTDPSTATYMGSLFH
jgi:Zn-dependent protease